MNQSINTDSKNSKEPQQKYRLGTVSIKILGGLNRFYRRLTSPSASIMAQNIQLFGPRGGFLIVGDPFRSIFRKPYILDGHHEPTPWIEPRPKQWHAKILYCARPCETGGTPWTFLLTFFVLWLSVFIFRKEVNFLQLLKFIYLKQIGFILFAPTDEATVPKKVCVEWLSVCVWINDFLNNLFEIYNER